MRFQRMIRDVRAVILGDVTGVTEKQPYIWVVRETSK